MTSIGETLRRQRLEQGLELQQLSQTTKIGTRMLQAMEQNDFSKLPGGVFTRSFLKQYAAALGLNPTVLDEQLKGISTGTEEPAKEDSRKEVIQNKHYSFSEYSSSTNSGSMLMSIFWIVAAIAVTGVVYYYMNRPQPAPVTRQESKQQESKQNETPEEVKQETKPLESEPQPLAVAAPQTSPIHLDIGTTDDAWLSITVDGKSEFAGVMKADEKKTFDASEKIKLVTGNAGAVQLTWNGKPMEAIGPKGQVRVVEATPEGAHVVSPQVVPRTPPRPAPEP